MKLLMENWRGFVTETAKAQSYGDLYLFENGTVSTVSFYDKLNTLTESEEETTRFLEQWEKSIDYEFDRLNEIDVKSLTTDSIFYLSQQAMALIYKFKDNAGKIKKAVMGALRRIGGFIKKRQETLREKYPKIYKAARFALQMIALGLLLVMMNSAQAAGLGEPETIQQFIQILMDVGLQDNAQDLLNATNNGTEGLTPETFSQLSDSTRQGIQEISNAWQQAAGEAGGAVAQAAETAQETISALPEPVLQAYETGNLPTQTLGHIQTIIYGGEGAQDAMQSLIDIQNRGSFEALNNVDLSSLDRQGLVDLFKQIQGDLPGGTATADSGPGRVGSMLQRLRGR